MHTGRLGCIHSNDIHSLRRVNHSISYVTPNVVHHVFFHLSGKWIFLMPCWDTNVLSDLPIKEKDIKWFWWNSYLVNLCWYVVITDSLPAYLIVCFGFYFPKLWKSVYFSAYRIDLICHFWKLRHLPAFSLLVSLFSGFLPITHNSLWAHV